MPSASKVFYIQDEASEQELRLYMPDTLTVIMPAFNAAATIEESIRSVMTQTYKEWVLLVIDDGSTDDTLQICQRLASEDERIIPVSVSHRGLCGVLNLGLRVSRGQLIARMDADDLSYPTRFSKQVEFLVANPSVKVLGTWGDHVNDAGKSVQKLRTGPISLAELEQQRQAREGIPLVHTSVMAFRETLLAFGGYSVDEYPAEDLWLWSKVAQKHDVLALPEDLVGYRINARGISNTQFRVQLLQHRRLQHWLRCGELLDREAYQKWEQANVVRRVRLYHDYLYRYCFRRGAALYVNGKGLKGLMYLAACAVINPGVFAGRAWKRATTPGDVSRRTPLQPQVQNNVGL